MITTATQSHPRPGEVMSLITHNRAKRKTQELRSDSVHWQFNFLICKVFLFYHLFSSLYCYVYKEENGICTTKIIAIYIYISNT